MGALAETFSRHSGENIILADIHGHMAEDFRYFADNFDSLVVGSGKRDIALEIPRDPTTEAGRTLMPSIQSAFDDFAAGHINVEDLRGQLMAIDIMVPDAEKVEIVRQLSRIAEEARENDVRIHTYDHAPDNYQAQQTARHIANPYLETFYGERDAASDLFRDARAATEARYGAGSADNGMFPSERFSQVLQEMFVQLPRDEQQAIREALIERMEEADRQRLGRDEQFVDYLESRGVDLRSGNLIAMIGAGHTKGTSGFDDIIEQRSGGNSVTYGYVHDQDEMDGLRGDQQIYENMDATGGGFELPQQSIMTSRPPESGVVRTPRPR